MSKGFTRADLLVVLAIVAAVASIGVVSVFYLRIEGASEDSQRIDPWNFGFTYGAGTIAEGNLVKWEPFLDDSGKRVGTLVYLSEKRVIIVWALIDLEFEAGTRIRVKREMDGSYKIEKVE
ncbi:MAG: hypothetical protein Q8L24_01140 [bacterium]|nr:hypothetical protein [bacterium]